MCGLKMIRLQRGDSMGELYEPYPRLPKNIRQIGERDQVLKLYVEDYVNTYLKRLKPFSGTDVRVGLLLGNVEMRGETPYVFVDGALEMEGVSGEGETVAFTQEAWKKAYQDVEQMFPKRTVQGWFICGASGCNLSPLNYWKQHGQYFTGKNQLMYLNSGLEGEEAIYITSPDGFYKLKGYSIFYERNQMMQDYMVLRKDAHRVETGGDDKVIRDFKKRMDERRNEAVHEKGTVKVLTGLCGVLTVTVLAGGVAMFGNFRKMQEMESVIASVLPGGAVMEETITDVSGKGFDVAAGPDYVIEEAKGNIQPVGAGTSQGQDGLLEGQTGQGGLTGGQTGQGGEAAAAAGPGGAGATAESGSKITLETMSPTRPQGEAENGGGENAGSAGQPEGGGSAAGKGNAGSAGQSAAGNGSAGQSGAAGSAGQTGGSGNAGQTESSGATSQSAQERPVISDTTDYQVYQIAEGETLYGICFKLYGNLDHLEEICAINGLENENSIYAGQKLLMP